MSSAKGWPYYRPDKMTISGLGLKQDSAFSAVSCVEKSQRRILKLFLCKAEKTVARL